MPRKTIAATAVSVLLAVLTVLGQDAGQTGFVITLKNGSKVVGRVLARKARSVDAKRFRLLVCFGLATLLMIAGMPWPGRPGGRPLFRM